MHFYLGNSIDEINVNDTNVEFSDELIDYIYKLSKHTLYNMSKLYGIDPYDDVEIPKNDLSEIIEICNYLLNLSMLKNYDEKDEGIQMLQNLIQIATSAVEMDIGLVSIGD